MLSDYLILSIELQAFAAVRFLFHYALPVSCFAYCYGCIFHTIRRHGKVVAGHAGRGGQAAAQDQNAGQIQQQDNTNGYKLSRKEMNVLQTMISVIICFMMCFTVGSIANFFRLFEVSRTVNEDLRFLLFEGYIKFWAYVVCTLYIHFV